MSEKAIPLPDIPKPPGPSAVQIQQEYYEAIGSVDWELFKKDDRKYLLQKIAVALCGPPTKEGNLGKESKDKSEIKTDDANKNTDNKNYQPGGELELQGYEAREEESIMGVFNKICEQAKYSHDGENILIKILRVICVIPKEEVPFYKITPVNYWCNLHNKKGDVVHTYVFHVFCLRQCIPSKQGVIGCRIYIDHDARVYKSWDEYLTENQLLKCVMVVPENGRYSGTFGSDVDLTEVDANVMPRVKLSVVPSPALGIGARVLSATDTISTVANVGALVGIAGAFALPAIAPAALATAVGVGAVTGTYAIVRGSILLADRSKHEQSIGLMNPEARNCWINILVSTAGISCSAAGKLLAWAASSGTNVKILMNAVQILQYTNLGSGAIGVVNSFGDMVYKYHKYNEIPTKLEFFQLTTSVLFLGIGAMSNQTAQEIVQDAQSGKINEVRDSLSSNNKKKMFDKVTAETRRTKGTIQGNSEVIRALKKIDNKDEFFGKLRGMNKQMNKNKLRISFASDGNPVINNQHNIKVADLQALGKRGRDQLFAKYGPAKVNSKNVPTRVYPSNTSANCTNVEQNFACYVRPEEIIKVTNFIINLSTIEQDLVADLLSRMSEDVHDAFLLICAEIIASLIPSQIDELLSIDRQYKVRVILSVFDYLKKKIHVDYSDNTSVLNVLKRYIRDGKILKETILEFIEALFKRIKQKKMFDDPAVFDIMHEYESRVNKKFLFLQAEETIKVGNHDVLIKNSTVEKLEEWFDFFRFNQNQIDSALHVCFEIISSLSIHEVIELDEVNLDDDIIKLTTEFLLFGTYAIHRLLTEEFSGHILSGIALHILKENLMVWRLSQMRAYDVCKICQGRRYK